MADKQLGITVTGDINDILSKLKQVADAFNTLTGSNIEIDTTSIDVASKSTETLKENVNQTSEATNRASEQFNGMGDKIRQVGDQIRSGIGSGLDWVKSKLDEFNTALGTVGSAITSAFGALGMGSIMQMTIGLAMTRERMTTLMMATMGSKEEALEFTKVLDKLTDKSLVSLNDLGQAMSKIKMTTGITNAELEMIAPTVNDIGQRAILMGRSTEEAQELMVASFRGLNGNFMVLRRQFGITREALLAAGWSGAADDVQGYNDALVAVLEKGGNMDEMLNTMEGQIALMQKAFSKAGREIGEIFVPMIKSILDFGVYLKETNPWVFKLVIGVGGLVSLFAMLLPVLGSIIGGFQKLAGALTLTNLKQKYNTAIIIKNRAAMVLDTIATYANVAATRLKAFWTDKVSISTIKTMAYQAAHVVWSGIQTAATWLVTAAQIALNAAMTANPIGLVVVAIAALVAGLYLLYQHSEDVRNAINGLWDSISGLGEYIAGGFLNLIGNMTSPFQQLYNSIVKFGSDLYTAGKRWIGNLLRGMTDSIPKIEDILQQIADYFPHSPAKTGPLSKVTPNGMRDYGVSLGTSFGRSFKKSAEQELKSAESKSWIEYFKETLVGTSPFETMIGFMSTGLGHLIVKTYMHREATINSANAAVEAAQKAKDAQKAHQESVRQTIDAIDELGETTVAVYDRSAAACMNAMDRMEYRNKIAAHNAAVEWEKAVSRIEGAFSLVGDVLSSAGLDMPKKQYTPYESQTIIKQAIDEKSAELRKLQDSGASYAKQLAVKKEIEQLKSIDLNKAGYNTGSSWSAGLGGGVLSNARNIDASASKATAGLKGRSPPKTGPLQKIDEWGKNIANAFVTGMQQGLTGLAIPSPAGISGGAMPMLGGGGDTTYNINIENINMGDESQARKVGTKIYEGFTDKLSKQASTAGVNIGSVTRG